MDYVMVLKKYENFIHKLLKIVKNPESLGLDYQDLVQIGKFELWKAVVAYPRLAAKRLAEGKRMASLSTYFYQWLRCIYINIEDSKYTKKDKKIEGYSGKYRPGRYICEYMEETTLENKKHYSDTNISDSWVNSCRVDVNDHQILLKIEMEKLMKTMDKDEVNIIWRHFYYGDSKTQIKKDYPMYNESKISKILKEDRVKEVFREIHSTYMN